MGGLDKLEAPLLGRPLLRWTVERMSSAACLRRLVLVAASARVERLRNADWLPGGALVVEGGPTRSASVLAGLRASEAPLVLVHDGARPLATGRLADRVAQATAQEGAAVPVLPVVDALKTVRGQWLAGVAEREALVRAQTPQGARRDVLIDAYEAAGGVAFGDEAELLQSRGVPVATVAGEAANLKVTEAADLQLAGALLAAEARASDDENGRNRLRHGWAEDSHPFGPEDGLWLGGLLIEEAPRLYGHSDGDVVLHALASALLAAGGLGDLGRRFPAGEPATRGIASASLLSEVLADLRRAGLRPLSAQVGLRAGRPRLGPARLEQMRARLSALLELPVEQVSLSASSANLSGPEGEGRAISATASVSLVAA